MKAFDAVEVELLGKNLVEASAGTGKTYAITTLFVRLVTERRLMPRDIAVVTFTEAATAELRERVRARLVEAEAAYHGTTHDPTLAQWVAQRSSQRDADLEQLRRAIDNMDEASIATIHGFCQRLLHDNAFRTGIAFGAELVTDLEDLYDDVLYDFWHREVAAGSHGLVSDLKNLSVDITRLRGLFGERRRNPRMAVVPEATLPSAAELLSARRAVQAELARFDGLRFVAEHCKKSRFGSGAAMAQLLDDARFWITSADTDTVAAPKNIHQLFPSQIAAALKVKHADHPSAGDAFFPALEQLARLHQRRVIALEHRLLERAPAELEARKDQLGLLGFEDLLQRLAKALEGNAALAHALRQRFGAVLIDEFQDTDPVQSQIFLGVWGNSQQPLFLIGDPKQAIYGFRGADVFTYLAAKPGARAHTMSVNWRSDRLLLDGINQLFERPDAFLARDIGYHCVGARPEAPEFALVAGPDSPETKPIDLFLLRRHNDAKPVNKPEARRTVARVVAADIARLLQSKSRIDGDVPRPLGEGDIAVLTRTNAQCFLVQDALRAKGIHCVVQSDQSVFDTEEAGAVQFVLGAVLEPTSNFELRRALATMLFDADADAIAALDHDPGAAKGWAERFRGWHQLWVERGFIRMFRALLAEGQCAEKLLSRTGGDRRLTNTLHLGELLHRAATEQHLGPAALCRWLAAQRRGASGMASAEHAEIRLESDEAAVRILTVHKAKGLEFPVVYCPYLWDKSGGGSNKAEPVSFHDDRRVATLDVDVDPIRRAPNVQRAEEEQFAEELRVVYVALTRAKHRCSVVWGGLSGFHDSAAAHLLHPGLPRNVTDSELEASLQRRVSDAIGLRGEAWDFDQPALERECQVAPKLLAREVEARIARWQRTDSFSGFLRGDPHTPIDLVEEPEHDEEAPDAPPLARDEPAPAATPIALASFPKGRRTGNFLHSLFEDLDFTCRDARVLADLTRAKLAAFGFSADSSQLSTWHAEVTAQVQAALDTPLLTGHAMRLRDVPTSHRFNELEFRLPVTKLLDRRGLAAAFRQHPSVAPAGAVPRSYAERVEALHFRALEGYLKGYIDLVFEHEGRWYVVDYKSNHLGDTLEEYSIPQLTEAMEHAHYFLQYHLYALATHRYLALMKPGYRYERDFGGVLYLFVKGMHPEHTGSGVFFEKPPLARIEALSAALGAVETTERGARR